MQSIARPIIEEYDNTMSYGALEQPLALDSNSAALNGGSETTFTGDTFSSDIEDKNKVIFFPIQRPTKSREKELQWWIGKVIEVQDGRFRATLEDLSGRMNLVEFDMEFVSERDREFLFVGSRFTYSVSIVQAGSGSTEYRTRIAFDSRRRWLESYEDNVQRITEEIFPENLLDL
jgi:hypothetical protein